MLALLDDQSALVKTVKNGDWLGLAWQMSHGNKFRTSMSLPPRAARGMQLFGRASSGCAGLIWSLPQLELDDRTGVFCWPSGYFAKTEHNMHIGRDGTVALLGGRDARLVSLQQAPTTRASKRRARANPMQRDVCLLI